MDNCIPPEKVISVLRTIASNKARSSYLANEIWDHPVLAAGLKLCYDPNVTFGVKAIPERTGSNKAVSNLSWVAFRAIVDKLIARELTGNDAKNVIRAMMERSTNNEWNNWYRPILQRKFRCGVALTTINKILGKLTTKEVIGSANTVTQAYKFSCMLAGNGVDRNGKIKTDTLVGLKMVQPKLDGVRCLAFLFGNAVTLYSRNGKVLKNFPGIIEALKTRVIPRLDGPIIFDGEIVSGSFQTLMTQVQRKKDVDTSDAVFHIFDAVNPDDFVKGKSSVSTAERYNSFPMLLLVEGVSTNLKRVSCREFNFSLDVNARVAFNEYYTKILDEGYEGVMVKDPDAPYVCKRSDAWLKVKPFLDLSLTVTRVDEGSAGTKYVGMMGSVLCEGTEEGKKIRVNVGSGFSDFERQEFWARKDAVIGSVIEIQADILTQSAGNEDGVWSARFPRFVRFRGFDNGEKI